jgi:hypothetical protein
VHGFELEVHVTRFVPVTSDTSSAKSAAPVVQQEAVEPATYALPPAVRPVVVEASEKVMVNVEAQAVALELGASEGEPVQIVVPLDMPAPFCPEVETVENDRLAAANPPATASIATIVAMYTDFLAEPRVPVTRLFPLSLKNPFIFLRPLSSS